MKDRSCCIRWFDVLFVCVCVSLVVCVFLFVRRLCLVFFPCASSVDCKSIRIRSKLLSLGLGRQSLVWSWLPRSVCWIVAEVLACVCEALMCVVGGICCWSRRFVWELVSIVIVFVFVVVMRTWSWPCASSC